jgi:hypothetical protein
MFITQLLVYIIVIVVLSTCNHYKIRSLQTLFSKYQNWKKYIQIVKQWGTLLLELLLLMHELVIDPIQQHATTCKGHEIDMHKE